MRSHAAPRFVLEPNSLSGSRQPQLQIIPKVYSFRWTSLLDKMTVVAVLVIVLEKYESLEAQEVRWTTGMWKNIFP